MTETQDLREAIARLRELARQIEPRTGAAAFEFRWTFRQCKQIASDLELVATLLPTRPAAPAGWVTGESLFNAFWARQQGGARPAEWSSASPAIRLMWDRIALDASALAAAPQPAALDGEGLGKFVERVAGLNVRDWSDLGAKRKLGYLKAEAEGVLAKLRSVQPGAAS